MESDAVPSIAQETEVMIAGAGPVGLALALELQRFGIRFRIVEKKAERSTTSKALGLQPRVSEAFAILGVADKFFTRGFAGIRALNLNTKEKKLLTLQMQLPPDMAGRDACQPRLIIIPQSETEEILETTLAERGQTVERGRELIGFDQTNDLVNAVIRDEKGAEESIPAKFVVSCEGAHSVIRKLAGFTFTGATFPLRFLLADVTIDWDLPDNEVQAWFHRDGTCAALPFGGQRWRLIAECAEDSNDTAPEVTLEFVRDLVIERTGKANARIRDPLWLSDFRINTRMVDRFRDRRLFVAGDAAHIHSPAGGQGIATGIQDAANLAWKLAACLRENAPDSLLDTYDEERKPIAREVLGRTSAVSSILFAMNPFARLFRERLLAPILRTRFIQQRLITKLSQLEMNYRGRSLSVDSERSAGVRVRAGDRAPDVMFSKEGGKTSLFELIGRYGMVALLGQSEKNQEISAGLGAVGIQALVVLAKSAGATGLRESLEDIHGDFGRLYGAQGPFLYLLRPDGHVGLYQGRADRAALSAYLRKIRSVAGVERAFAL